MHADLFHVVARRADVTPGAVLHVELAGQEIAIYNLGGEFFATSDRCTHMRARLSDGYVNAGVIECPLHFGKFDIRTGRALSAPCKLDLAVFRVKLEGDAVLVWGDPIAATPGGADMSSKIPHTPGVAGP